MYHVIETETFSKWLHSLKDSVTKARLLKRLRKVSLGNLGDVKFIGDGVFEMCEFFGPGWRMYYVQRGDIVIVMLGGGTKSTQGRDIQRAIALAQELNHD
jgi:putative addiction module killer protein